MKTIGYSFSSVVSANTQSTVGCMSFQRYIDRYASRPNSAPTRDTGLPSAGRVIIYPEPYDRRTARVRVLKANCASGIRLNADSALVF